MSMAIASFARSHIGCYDRACGDGPWYFFLPYRALFPVVIVGFVASYPPCCRCVADGEVMFISTLVLSDACRGSWILGWLCTCVGQYATAFGLLLIVPTLPGEMLWSVILDSGCGSSCLSRCWEPYPPSMGLWLIGL